MKKITAILSALALTLALCGCDKKTSDSEPSEVSGTTAAEDTATVDDPVGVPENTGFRELTDDDFTKIEMNFTMSDDLPPVELNCIDLEGVDFGSRMSPCKTGEYFEEKIQNIEAPNDEARAELEAQYRTLYETEIPGQVGAVAEYDGKFYFFVNYDDLDGKHDSSLFRFDPETKACDEVITHTGFDRNCVFYGLKACGNYLYYYTYNAPFDETIYQIEPNTCKEKKLADVDFSINGIVDASPYIYVYGLKQNGEDDYVQISKTIDPVTGEDVGDPELLEHINYVRSIPVLCDGKPCEVTGGNGSEDGSTVTIKTQYYSLDTYISQYNSVFAWKDRVGILVNSDHGLTEYRLYTYDLKTMERTMVKLNGFNGIANKAGDGIVLSMQKSNWGLADYNFYYYMPEFGTAFLFDTASSAQETGDFLYRTFEGDDLCLFMMLPPEDAGQYSGSQFGAVGKPLKMYWFEN